MRAALAQAASIAITLFAVSSILSVGLAYRIGLIIGPLRESRAVFPALVANFVLLPLLAIAIERVILRLFLLAGSAGAPFLIKLASAARRDLALRAALLLLLVPVGLLPSVLRAISYGPSFTARPLLRPLQYFRHRPAAPLHLNPFHGAGAPGESARPGWAARLGPIGGKLATIALVVVVLSTFGAKVQDLISIVKGGAVLAGVLLVAGAFAMGFLLSRLERSAVLGLGTAQRNVAGAMVIASRDFNDPDILVMVTASVLAGLLLLFAIAWLLSRRTPHVGVPTPEAIPVRATFGVEERPSRAA
jgi:BASS family bile acid:Na+ symporter